MCMGCMANGDFLLTSGILGAASVRVGLRRYLPGLPTWPRKVSDDEALDFVASLAPTAEPKRNDDDASLATPGSTAKAADSAADVVHESSAGCDVTVALAADSAAADQVLAGR